MSKSTPQVDPSLWIAKNSLSDPDNVLTHSLTHIKHCNGHLNASLSRPNQRNNNQTIWNKRMLK